MPELIGYFVKRPGTPSEWIRAAVVEEVCSVADCCSEEPESWMDHWIHNCFWLFDTPELARSVVPETDHSRYDLFAYRLFPYEWEEGIQVPFQIPPLKIQTLPPTFERLGCDIVSRTMGNAFEHSPLSCNGWVDRVAVNRCCLVDAPQIAFQLAVQFEAGCAEPGPYFVVEVWREKRSP